MSVATHITELHIQINVQVWGRFRKLDTKCKLQWTLEWSCSCCWEQRCSLITQDKEIWLQLNKLSVFFHRPVMRFTAEHCVSVQPAEHGETEMCLLPGWKVGGVLSPVAFHLTAHCDCSVLFHFLPAITQTDSLPSYYKNEAFLDEKYQHCISCDYFILKVNLHFTQMLLTWSCNIGGNAGFACTHMHAHTRTHTHTHTHTQSTHRAQVQVNLLVCVGLVCSR